MTLNLLPSALKHSKNMTERNTSKPDTLVKFFRHEFKNKEEEVNFELIHSDEAQKNSETHSGCLLHLRESLQGNIFNRSFQYIWLRNIFVEEKNEMKSKTKGCRDAEKDYFVTLEKRECLTKFIDNSWQNNRLDSEKRYVILAYKTLDELDEKHCFSLERSWKDWTGTNNLVNELAKMYKISQVCFLKGLSNVPGSFRYVVLIELLMNFELNQSDNYALACLQKFRIKRMSGYVALYVPIQ